MSISGAAMVTAVAGSISVAGLAASEVGMEAQVATACETDGVEVDYQTAFDAVTADYQITEVTVSNIDPDCIGHLIEVGLTNGTGTSSANTIRESLDESGSITLEVLDGFSASDLALVAVVIQTD
jgi:hypothetical protein